MKDRRRKMNSLFGRECILFNFEDPPHISHSFYAQIIAQRVEAVNCLLLLVYILSYLLLNTPYLRKICNVTLIRFVKIHGVPAILHVNLSSESIRTSDIGDSGSLGMRMNTTNAATH